jgi:hypothetical protein
VNTELARTVVVHALAYPEQHDQSYWVDNNYNIAIRYADTLACPTTACLPGWTVWFGANPSVLHRLVVNDYMYDRWVSTAARILGIMPTSFEYCQLNSIFINTRNDQWAIKKFAKLFNLDMEECILEAKKLREDTA